MAASRSTGTAYPSLTFRSIDRHTPGPFGPRCGVLSLERESPSNEPDSSPLRTTLEIQTPGLFSLTSRGVLPHLSWDHVRKTSAIKWVHVPFESLSVNMSVLLNAPLTDAGYSQSSLERSPPVPTLIPGNHPLHTFLGFPEDQYIVSVSLRDPNDAQDVRPNGKDFVSAMCLRGVKQVTSASYHSYLSAIKPDIIFSLSDILIVQRSPSEKRVVKSLERSLRWLGELLRSTITRSETSTSSSRLPAIFVHMVGGISDVARDDFATGLLERLEGADARELKPLGLETLEEGVSGYSFDLVPLRMELLTQSDPPSVTNLTRELTDLIQVSLRPLPSARPRLVTGVTSPHEILALVRTGIDVFDSHFAQRAADWGIALDFRFPAPPEPTHTSGRPDSGDVVAAKRDIGVNLYEGQYSLDFRRLAETFRGEGEEEDDGNQSDPICHCIACSPQYSSDPLIHSSLDSTSTPSAFESPPPTSGPPVSRAYLHHLLHTHEMSAHAMLASHNITVLSAFFASIRTFIQQCTDDDAAFDEEIARFHAYYLQPDLDGGVFERAKQQWKDVELARGKGRLAREKAAKEKAAVEEHTGVVVDQEGLMGVAAGVMAEDDQVTMDVVADEVLGA